MPGEPLTTLTASDRLVVWSTIASRRSSYDAMLWQTPALGLTAQAFLLTLALGPGTSALGRFVSAGLSLALSFMVIQLLVKHRQGEMADSFTLARLEESLGFQEQIGVLPHGAPSQRIAPADLAAVRIHTGGLTPGPQRFWDMSSVKLWVRGQWVFAAVALGVMLIVPWEAGLLR